MHTPGKVFKLLTICVVVEDFSADRPGSSHDDALEPNECAVVWAWALISLLPFSFFFSVNQSADWHNLSSSEKERGWLRSWRTVFSMATS
jgi:hypothetical protein